MKSINRTSTIGPEGNRDHAASRDRAANFRRTHHVGQILHGRLIRHLRGNQAWVHVGGHELIAELRSQPEPGVPLRFLVVQLLPDILLREITEDEAARHAGTATPHAIIKAYISGRDALDALLHAHLWPTLPALPVRAPLTQLEARRQVVADFIAGNDEALTTFTAMRLALAGVNALLASAAQGTLRYMPWLLPQGRSVELLHSRGEQASVRLILGAELPGSGRSLIQCLAGTERMAYRLFLERADHADAVETLCRTMDAAAGPEALPTACLGAGPLPHGMHDVLTCILPAAVFTRSLHVQA